MRVRRVSSKTSVPRSGFADLPSRYAVLALIIVMSGLDHAAHAASIPYPLSAFTLENSNADGSAVAFNGGLSVLLTGGNNGSGLAGTTDLITTATGPASILVQYLYSSLDSPGFDAAGYLIGSTFTQFADADGEFGTATFSVIGGEVFGFRVVTLDNTSEPGLLSLSSFVSTASVPEPGTLPFSFAAILAITVVQCRGGQHRQRQGRKS